MMIIHYRFLEVLITNFDNHVDDDIDDDIDDVMGVFRL